MPRPSAAVSAPSPVSPEYLCPAGVLPLMDADTLAALLDRHAAALALFARSWCAAPEDAVQEAFVRLAALRTPPDNVRAWLYRAVRNAALDQARAERRRKQHETVAAARAPTWLLPSPADDLDAQQVSAALAELPAEQREVVVAHLWGGLTFEEIGALASCSASTAYRHYVSTLEALRRRLRVPCPDSPPTT